MREYTRSQLALHNGTEKETVWIAYDGVIYDVSASRLWRDGKHYEHWAGQDLTSELSEAPHTDFVFDRMPKVGILKTSEQ